MILVTGATGTVGSHVVRILHNQGTPFRAGIHNRPLEMAEVKSCIVDYNQPETLLNALEGVHAVFLVLSMNLNEGGMLSAAGALIEAARSQHVERIVKLSAYGAEQEGYPHARWHRNVEREIEKSGLDWTFLRPNAFMQTLLQGWAETIRAESSFYDAVEGACYAPIDAQDIARVAARALTERGHEGKAYELTGPEVISWEDAAEMLSDVLDRSIRYIRISDEELRQSLIAEGYSDEMAAAWAEVHQYTRRVPSVVTTNVKDITGREPVSFAEFCREYAPALGLV